ncbi:TIGR03808 family TAT-translocated repetitive protein [Chthonobacter albigriseus]|uniref:TIGR03808 family TAT-translocated repetitive protein n=1 Tax=Chthonobacter albigriseus TaxID=1683161 RepID=UPI0015EEB519|nr:TIGR03808 family TAT-translocated repetitive protein [Chthonobacter albigriseus]
MDRRAFLFATAAAAVSGTVPAAAAPERIDLVDLRGTLAATDAGVHPGAVDDQSVELQAAIDRAAAEAKPLFLPPGRYEVSNLTLPSGMRLVGVPGQTRLVYGGGGHLVYAANGSGISLDGLTLDGANRALGDYAPGLVHFMAMDDVTLERSAVIGSSRNGLALERVSGRINGSRISGARDAGIWSVDGQGLTITDNLVADCGDGGILVHRWTKGEDGTIVSQNRVERIGARSGGTGQNGNGINVFRADGVVVSSNRVADCAFSAVRSNAGSNVQIAGNSCFRSGETAIYSEFGFEGAMVSGNIVDGASIGISIANFNDGGRLAVVSGNMIRNLRHGAPYPDEHGLDFGIGISVEADASVTGNVIDGAPSVGLLLGWGPYLRNIVATGNMIRDSKVGVGVSVVDGVGDVMIANNLFSATPDGAVRGMRWAEFVSDDLTRIGTADLPHITLSANRIG